MPNPDSTRRTLEEIAALEQEFGLVGMSVTVKDPEYDVTASEIAPFMRDIAHRSIQITDEVFAQMNAKEAAAALVS